MTIPNIIADIKSDLKSYAESGLIDEISLKIHLINELKRFGGLVMDVYPQVLEIKNSQAKLPDHFFALYKAIRTHPIGCHVENEEDSDDFREALIGNTFYRVRKEASQTWDNMSHEFTQGDYTEVVEKVYLNNKNIKADFYYGHHQPLQLVEGFDRSKLAVECENTHIKKSPYQINIINNTLQTNFSKGFVCIWFQGLRIDEYTEEIILPEDPNARIYEFLKYSGKALVFENLWANGDDADVQAKLQYFSQEREKARTAASYQIRFASVTGKNWWKGLKGKQRKRTLVLENYAYRK